MAVARGSTCTLWLWLSLDWASENLFYQQRDSGTVYVKGYEEPLSLEAFKAH